jgi:hypothetical protein
MMTEEVAEDRFSLRTFGLHGDCQEAATMRKELVETDPWSSFGNTTIEKSKTTTMMTRRLVGCMVASVQKEMLAMKRCNVIYRTIRTGTMTTTWKIQGSMYSCP